MEKKTSDNELETKLLDYKLFIELLQLFEKMSKRGKHATVETLSMYLVKEE